MSWFCGAEHYDTVFVNADNTCEGMQAMEVAQIVWFFSLPWTSTNGVSYSCALVHWFDYYVVDEPDELTGRMWIVKPPFLDDNTCYLSVVHIDTIVHVAHQIFTTSIFGQKPVPLEVNLHNSLDI